MAADGARCGLAAGRRAGRRKEGGRCAGTGYSGRDLARGRSRARPASAAACRRCGQWAGRAAFPPGGARGLQDAAQNSMVGARRSGSFSRWSPWPGDHVTLGGGGRGGVASWRRGAVSQARPGRRRGAGGGSARGASVACAGLFSPQRGDVGPGGAGFRGGSAATSAPPEGPRLRVGVRSLRLRRGSSEGRGRGKAQGTVQALLLPPQKGAGGARSCGCVGCGRRRCPRSLLLLSSGVGAGAGSAQAFRHRTAPFWLIKE